MTGLRRGETLPLMGGVVRVLGTVGQVPAMAVLDTWQNVAVRRAVALELIRDDAPADISTAIEELVEECLGRLLTPPPLYENIQHLAPVIHRTPQTVVLLLDRDEHLIQVSLITGTRTSASQLIGLLLAKFPTPLADRFVRPNDPPRP